MENRQLIFYAISVILVILVLTQYRGIGDKFYVSPDTRSMFTVYHFPEGLKDNIMVQYFATKTGSKTPVINSYAFINKYTDFILFTKLIPIILFLISSYYIYRLGRKIINRDYALILTIIFSIFAWAIFPLSGGTSRSFAVPLIIAFLYYLIHKNQWKLAITTILLAIVYPPVWLVSLGIYGLSKINFKEKKIEIKLKENLMFYFSVLISIILILLTMFTFSYGFDEPITFQEALHLPEFYLNGRIPLFKAVEPVISAPVDIIKTVIYLYNFGIKTPIVTNSVFILLILTTIFTIKYWKKNSLPKEIYFLIASSIFFQILASLVMFKLYFPNRYVTITIPLFLIILLSQGIYQSFKQKTSLTESKLSEVSKGKLSDISYGNFQQKKKLALYLFIPLLIMVLILLNFSALRNQFSYCPDQELYTFLQKLPADTVFASHPDDADCIALYSKKMPFLTSETAIPFDKKYYNIIKTRTFAFFSAYYSTKKSEVLDFCEKNNVDYFIVNKKHFTTEYLNKKQVYLNPFNDHVKTITNQKVEQEEYFYFDNPEKIIFMDKEKYVVRCNPEVDTPTLTLAVQNQLVRFKKNNSAS